MDFLQNILWLPRLDAIDEMNIQTDSLILQRHADCETTTGPKILQELSGKEWWSTIYYLNFWDKKQSLFPVAIRCENELLSKTINAKCCYEWKVYERILFWENLLYPDATALNERGWELCKLATLSVSKIFLINQLWNEMSGFVETLMLFSGMLWCKRFTGEYFISRLRNVTSRNY